MQMRTPDGRNLTVKGNPWPFINRWAYIVWAYGPKGGIRFQVNPAGSTEVVSRALGIWPKYKVREVSWKGSQLLSVEDQAGTTFVRVGPHDELSIFVNGTSVPMEMFMDNLEQFDIRDTVDGMTMLPRPGSTFQLSNLFASNTIDQLCSVQIKPVADVAQIIPRGQGMKVPGGSMWRIDERDESGDLRLRSAFVVNDTAATTVIAAEPTDPKFVSVVDALVCSLN